MLRAIAIIVAIAGCAWLTVHLRQTATSTPAPISIERILEVSELTVLKVPFHQAVETSITGYTGGTRCVLLAAGEAMISTDLSAAKLEIHRIEKQVSIALPQPRVISSRLNHSLTRIILMDRHGLWQAVPGPAGERQLVSLALRRAETGMGKAAGNRQHIAQARQRVEHVLSSLAHQHGWTVRVQWMR